MNESTLRVRAILEAQFTILVGVCLILALAGAGLAYGVHGDPDMETNERVVSTWSVDSEYTHSATVTEENSIFPVGTELTDRSTYFTRIAPELDGEVRTGYTAASAEDVRISLDVTLVMESADDDTTYWIEEEQLASVEETAGPEDVAVAPFSLNVSAIDDRLAEISDEIGSTPGETAVAVQTDVTVRGVIEGDQTEYQRTLELPLSIDGDTYSVSDPGPQEDRLEQTETEEVEREYGPLREYGSVLILLISLGGLGGLSVMHRRNALGLTPAERAHLDYKDDRSEFDEWITAIRLPDSAFDRPEATADSLGDLVEYAIDSDTGVVKAPDSGRYHVLAGEYLYTYVPPSVPGETGPDEFETAEPESPPDASKESPPDASEESPPDASEESPPETNEEMIDETTEGTIDETTEETGADASRE